MPQSTCKDCQNRHPGCHGECEDYKRYRQELEEYKHGEWMSFERWRFTPSASKAVVRAIKRKK